MTTLPQKISVPLGITYFSGASESAHPSKDAWDKVQDILGDGYISAVLSTPDRRGDMPSLWEIMEMKIPNPDANAVAKLLREMLYEWRIGFEKILNTRWSLCENPYAVLWILPGQMLLHEDPLGWVIDTHGEDILQQQVDLEDGRHAPTWTAVRPLPESGHEHIRQRHAADMPHTDRLNAYLTEKARDVELFERNIEGVDKAALKGASLAWALQPDHTSVLSGN